jgi:hypothetical protein
MLACLPNTEIDLWRIGSELRIYIHNQLQENEDLREKNDRDIEREREGERVVD